MTKKKTSINSNVRIKISQKEKIANDFLLQFAYAIGASIILLFIYNASLFKYGGTLGSAMPKILWVLFGICAAAGIVFIVLWKKAERNNYKITAIYLFATAAGFFWCVAMHPILFFLKNYIPFLSYFANTKRLMEILFILIGLSLVVEFIAYFYRMQNIKNKSVKKNKK